MSIKEHLDSAEESIRQAIIHCLNDKKDENIKDLFKALQLVKNINSIELGNVNLDFDYSYSKITNRIYFIVFVHIVFNTTITYFKKS